MNTFFLQTASFIFLLILACGVSFISSRYKKIPATLLLVSSGIIVALLAKNGILPFIDDFQLNSGVLFYVLLPILLFESAYHMQYSNLLKNIYSISALSFISLLISAFTIAIFLYFWLQIIGFPLPFIVTLLFWALISATDTASTLAVFKEVWVPKRLQLIFEWESLFNDGTAIALFLVVLDIIENFWSDTPISTQKNLFQYILAEYQDIFGIFFPFIQWSLTLFVMIAWGIILWVSIGIIFSKMIQKIQNETYLEITLSLALAHATFLLSEFLNYYFLPLSGIIATVAAAMVLWNYGRRKISPRVEEVMSKYWGFFTFVSNSMVFILVGILLMNLDVDWKPLIPAILLTIPIVILGRFFSVYPVFWFLNRSWLEEKVPATWQFILSWGALRWVIAIMLVLIIPENIILQGWEYTISIQDILLSLTIWVVLFSIFIKTLTLSPLIKKLQLNELSDIEFSQYLFENIILLEQSLTRIHTIREGRYIDEEEGDILKNVYLTKLSELQKELEIFRMSKGWKSSHILKRVFSLYALWIEQKTLLRLYKKNELNERTFKKILSRIRLQIDLIESGKGKIQSTKYIQVHKNKIQRFSEYILNSLEEKMNPVEQQYFEMRTLHMIIEKALEWLKSIALSSSLSSLSELKEVMEEYQAFDEDAENTRRRLFKAHREELRWLSAALTKNALRVVEEEYIEDHFEHKLISEKIAQKIKQGL